MVEEKLVRRACSDDVDALVEILNEIISIGGTTAHRRHFDREGVRAAFIDAARLICCFVCVQGSGPVGFQALEWSDPDWPGDDRLPADWAIIASYVKPARQCEGIGAALFERTREAARAAGVSYIDATIRRENSGGLKFYGRLGFTEYRRTAETIGKRIALK